MADVHEILDELKEQAERFPDSGYHNISSDVILAICQHVEELRGRGPDEPEEGFGA